MTATRSAPFVALAASAVIAIAMTAGAQTRSGGPPSDGSSGIAGVVPVVKNAPYSADAITTMTQVLGDGTKVERSVTAKVYRDSAGRTRREQTVLGLASLTRASDARRTITITDPVARVTITLDERAQTARRTATPFLSIGPVNRVRVFALPPSQQLDDLVDRLMESRRAQAPGQQPEVGDLLRELTQRAPGSRGGRGANTPADPAPGGQATVTALGARQIQGLSVTGRRITQTIPVGEIGNDRPIVVTDEIWESDAPKLVVASKHADPRTGTVDYRLANVTLGEPAADLFTIPPGYTVINGAQESNASGRRGGRQ
jgi:hypothetical protein